MWRAEAAALSVARRVVQTAARATTDAAKGYNAVSQRAGAVQYGEGSLMRLSCVTAALVLAVLAQTHGFGQQRPPQADADKDVAGLIDQLPRIAEGDVGYMPTMSGSGFLPLRTSEMGTALLGQRPPASSETMRRLVAHGAAAIPNLVAHLDDKRETKITLEHEFGIGGMFFDDEYDYNRRTAKAKPAGVNRHFGNSDERHPSKHAVTVGDLCFVALGQIVNRNFNAVRYQPTACIMVNSPTYSERLRKAILAEWGTVTPARHKELLVRDFQEPDHEGRRIGAAMRLGYYYPEELEPLVLEQLAQPLFDVFTVDRLVREKLYPAKDAQDRKALVDAFLATAGQQAKDGIREQLFDDLDSQEADEQGRLSPPLKDRYLARECLIELFGYPAGVKAEDKPLFVPNTDTSQARFIDAIVNFPSPRIDAAVCKVFQATEEDYLARACARYLVGRGADDEIRRYVAKRLPTADAGQQRELSLLQDQLGWTPLHAAAAEYQNERLEELIATGADVNVRSENGKTPLHVAAEHGGYGGLRVLIKHKADLNARDKSGKTAIQLGQGYADAVEILLEAGADAPDILIAAFAGRDDLVRSFLEKDKSLISVRSEHGETPLHYAAQRGHLKAAEALVAAGSDVNARDNDRNKLTPLHWAAIYGHDKVVTLLLAHKADRTAKDWDNKTALDHAREGNHVRVQRLLETP
jgi:ankyrin repeat protein